MPQPEPNSFSRVPGFDTWSHTNLVKIAHDLYKQLQKLDTENQILRNKLKDCNATN